MQECAICLGDIEERELLRMPECEHPYHRRCLLGAFQYNARCPTCRGTGGVAPREASSTRGVVLDDLLRPAREYERKERRLVRSRKHVADLQAKAKHTCEERKAMQKELHAHVLSRMEDMWRNDPEVQCRRRGLRNARRRELRREREFREAVESELGPRPTMVFE